jgi:polyisoprenoid-binding protein YceI
MTKVIGFNDPGMVPRRRRYNTFAKNKRMKNLLFLAMLLLSQTILGQNVNNGTLQILGTSNMHDWKSDATEVRVKGSFQMANGALQGIQDVMVTVPVEKIKSEKGRTMDKNTYDALNQKQHPDITFKADQVTVNGKDIQARGALRIAGQTKQVTVRAQWTNQANGTVRISGKHNLKMTDFGVDPPRAMLGAMRTGDDVTIEFSLDVRA